ncbi:MAG: hypothetical protein AB7G88_09010 [Thermomicrobiales bacterium]
MRKSSSPKRSSPARTLSGTLATLMTALADRLVYANVLGSQGALLRSMILPLPRLLAKVFRWWSRSYLGQRLGLDWSRQTYRAGHDKTYAPADVGDSWPQFRHGSVVMTTPKNRQPARRRRS